MLMSVVAASTRFITRLTWTGLPAVAPGAVGADLMRQGSLGSVDSTLP